MSRYILDTDVSVAYLRGSVEIIQHVQTVGAVNLCLSEITVAELKYGVEKSKRPEYNRQRVDSFCAKFRILPIYQALDVFAYEKARLERLGIRLDNFDLLIGSTAIRYDLVLVTNNVKHFERMQRLNLERWAIQEG
jgi:tRNA(fMet)-specific endonuclease VapC